jgi:hypothetical protein
MYIGNVGHVERRRIVDETRVRYPLVAFTVTIQTPLRTRTVFVPMNEHNVNVLEGAKIRKGMPVRIDGEINASLGIDGNLLLMMRLTYFETNKKQKGAKP